MKSFLKFLQFLLLFTGLTSTVNAQSVTDNLPANELMSRYALESGDKIRITVYREVDLTLETKLTDAGTIIYPFLGEINVAGLSVGELKDKITQGLSGRYLVDPKVSVTVLEYREFFVNGEVKKPGAFPYLPGLTVQKAISMAGGFTERASQSTAQIIRDKDTQQTAIEVNLDAPVSPGDVVIIEESFF